ncbi:hypothetical protein [Paenibacillus sp. FSL H8-0332]|uniref:hypothetical protein n=1 Tax=Paenibacillus sp. FSL H8-0332 TaxID=2954742 RepID=UPI0030D1B2FA
MYIDLLENEIKELLEKKLIQQISRWENHGKANQFYSDKIGTYYAYHEKNTSILKSAYSTPVIVFKLN